MTLRFGAVVRSLQSLRGDPAVAPLRPTEAAVRYRAQRRRGIAPLADVYVPARPTGASAVLVHGGAFVIGSRRMKPMRLLAARLSEAGIAVVSIDYRLMFRGGRLTDAIEDVRDALEFWVARAPQLGLDPGAVSMVGLSAGATIALLASARRDAPPLARLVGCFGLYDLGDLRGVAGVLPRLLCRTADRAVWVERSPRFAAQPSAPMLLLHGSDDGLVPAAQARQLAAHRESLGLPTRLVIYPGAPHGFFNLPSPASDAGVREIIDHVGAGADTFSRGGTS